MEQCHGAADRVPAASLLGKGDYEYAIPFYGKRRPILANLVFLPEAELQEKYDTIERTGDTLVVDIFIPDFRRAGSVSGQRRARSMTRRGT